MLHSRRLQRRYLSSFVRARAPEYRSEILCLVCPPFVREMEATESVAVTETFQGFLRKYPAVNFVRLQWVDFSGVLRTRIVTKIRCLQLAEGDDHYTLAQNCMIIPISTVPECFPEGPQVWELHPDWESLRVCGFAPKHSSVMCSISRKGAGEPHPRLTRLRAGVTLGLEQGEPGANFCDVG
jgi:hypothetical protein